MRLVGSTDGVDSDDVGIVLEAFPASDRSRRNILHVDPSRDVIHYNDYYDDDENNYNNNADDNHNKTRDRS